MRIQCFKHVPFEGPATIKDWAETRGHRLNCVEVHAGGALPGVDQFDLLLLMGGPMNIHEESKYPWLRREKAIIKEALSAKKYLVGVCLGAQLIAEQLGATVSRGRQAEIGWFPVHRSSRCPEGLPVPPSLRVFHWHGDSFTLPDGADLIFHSDACQNQGFLHDQRVLALQCHLETTRAAMDGLIDACSNEIVCGEFVQSAQTMREEPDSTLRTMQRTLFALLDHLTQDDEN